MGGVESAYTISVYLGGSDTPVDCSSGENYHFDVSTSTTIPVTVTVNLIEEPLEPPYIFTIYDVDIDDLEEGELLFEIEETVDGITVELPLTKPIHYLAVVVVNDNYIEDPENPVPETAFAVCLFTITTNISYPTGPLSVPMFVVDNQSVLCGGVYYQLCDLSARACPDRSECRVDVSGRIVTNEDEYFYYTLIVNPETDAEETHVGEVVVNDTEGETLVYPVRLRGEFTDLYVRFENEDESIVLECSARIRRLNSNIVNGIVCS